MRGHGAARAMRSRVRRTSAVRSSLAPSTRRWCSIQRACSVEPIRHVAEVDRAARVGLVVEADRGAQHFEDLDHVRHFAAGARSLTMRATAWARSISPASNAFHAERTGSATGPTFE